MNTASGLSLPRSSSCAGSSLPANRARPRTGWPPLSGGTTSSGRPSFGSLAQGIADLGDPTACIERAKDQEPERQKLAAFLEATAAVMEAKDWRVADLIRRVDQDWADGGPLQDALEEIAGDRGKINPRILGRWIERYANTRCAGYYLERRGSKHRAAVWRIRKYAA